MEAINTVRLLLLAHVPGCVREMCSREGLLLRHKGDLYNLERLSELKYIGMLDMNVNG